jgi:lipopolysaccharide/colanic/teichoic acid biosynthesis glycosyltransferase
MGVLADRVGHIELPATHAEPVRSRGLNWLERIIWRRLDPERLRRHALSRGYRLAPTHWEALAKRSLDLAIVLVFGIPAAITVALCAIAIRLESPGKALFSQLRTGKNGRRFKLWKLRTMVYNAEQLKEKYRHLNELPWPDFKITNDPRITWVGRFLRKTSLDELPQLWNVLTGDMSLVGPRPTSFASSTYSLWHTERLEFTPGLTGLWQVLARAESTFDERLRLDLAYIRGYSLWLDLELLLATALVVFTSKGAK